MKKSDFLFFVLFLILPAFTGFSQGQLFKTKLSPATDDSRFSVTATVMDNDTWCRITWPDPYAAPLELAYDDGEADDYFIYSNPGSLNATKFIPTIHPFIVTGGRIHVGNGSFPGPFLGTSFRVLVFDDDGEDGFPGTALDSMDVTVNNYEWVDFEGMTVEITEGDFYLAMKQLAPSPNAAPIGVDTDNPTYFNSYSYFQGAPGWVLSPLQDFMIRAYITRFNEPSRAIDSFAVARFSGFEYNESPLTGDTTVLDTTAFSEYNDDVWDELDPGLYAYGVKTLFSGGEWSDFDVSNLVTHIFYPFPPACFYQSDAGNQQLVICPPVDLNGTLPNFFTGFNLYVDGNFHAFLPPSVTSYILELPGPGIYSCMLTAVYELSIFGYPEETSESLPLFTDYAVRFGYPLPFLEQWIYGNFETNNWQPEGDNWSITGQEGNPIPCAQFTWDPIQTDYSIALESYPLLADSLTEGSIYLDFNLKLDNFSPTGTEQMLVQVWNWDSQEWSTVSSYSNVDGSFSWMSEHLDITSQAIETVFKIRFLAAGENSLNILGWYVDNIHVYRVCNPPENLDGFLDWNGMNLSWERPSGTGIEDQWIHWDDGEVSGNSIFGGYDWAVAARWTPDQLTDFEGATITQIAFVPGSGPAIYKVRVWSGEQAANLLIDQEVISPVINQWNYITLNTPVPIDIMQELWVGYHIHNDTGYPAGVDDGPAIDGYGNWIYWQNWQTLLEVNPELDFNWSIEAYIKQSINYDSVSKYAIYRSDDGNPYFLRDFGEQTYYVDDSVCGLPPFYHEYKISALYINGNDTCESAFSNETGDICIGVNDNAEIPDLKVYPNPASEVLFIESEEKIESVRIFDSRGITIEQWNNGTLEHWNSGTLKIPVNGLAPGLYLVRVETGNGVVGRKVVVRR